MKQIAQYLTNSIGIISLVTTTVLFIALFSIHVFQWPFSGKFVVVRSGSMEPAISVGSLLWLSAQASYQPSDIVAFTHPDSNTEKVVALHRIESSVKKEDASTYFVTKGDANQSADQNQVSETSVIGSPKVVIPYLGYFIGWLQSGVGITITLVLPIVLYVSHTLRSYYSKIKVIPPLDNRASNRS